MDAKGICPSKCLYWCRHAGRFNSISTSLTKSAKNALAKDMGRFPTQMDKSSGILLFLLVRSRPASKCNQKPKGMPCLFHFSK